MKRIPLRDRRGHVAAWALVDDEDFAGLSQWRWCRSGEYVTRAVRVGQRRTTISMHKQIMGLLVGDRREVDHIDGNGRNNQRSNLRICPDGPRNNGQNRRGPNRNNLSGFRGVARDGNRFTAQVKIDGRTRRLGELQHGRRCGCRGGEVSPREYAVRYGRTANGE